MTSPEPCSWMVAEPGPVSSDFLTQAQSTLTLAGGIGLVPLASFKILFLSLLVINLLAQISKLLCPVTMNTSQALQPASVVYSSTRKPGQIVDHL